MGNTSSRSETIEKSDREAQISQLLQPSFDGGYSSDAESEINVQIVDLQGGKGCGKEDDVYMIGGNEEFSEIDVKIVDLRGGAMTDNVSEIDVKIVDLVGGNNPNNDADHQAIYNEIKQRISNYQAGGSSNNEFFKMLEQKLNGIDSESPFMSNDVNKFAEALQKGGYNEETETATVTAKKLLNKIVQMGGDSSSSSDEDSDFTSTEGSSGEESSDSDSSNEMTTDTFAVYPVKLARKTAKDSDADSDEDPLLSSSSSLATSDINLISYSPR